ncbi:MAG TPA: flavoprotein [Iamia sp.]|jgi:phosphopantothenoylcysteine decarboxylase/phosphopantothenate--cysteine ligase|nr:flavoprotein [Iamia sp.]
MTYDNPPGTDRLPCSRLLVAVTGSVHALVVPQYLDAFRRSFADEIRVIMTEAATHLCSPRALEAMVGSPISSDLWSGTGPGHVELTQWADCFVVVPTTANCLAKAAHGLADDLVTTAIAAAPGPVVFAPAMNRRMWETGPVQRNIGQLRQDGHLVVEPTPALSLASGRDGEALGPTTDDVLAYMWHATMRRRRDAYWQQATAEAPAAPSGTQPRRTVALGSRDQPVELRSRASA